MFLMAIAGGVMIGSSISYHLYQSLSIDEGIEFGIIVLYAFLPASLFASLFKDDYVKAGFENSCWSPRKLQILPKYSLDEDKNYVLVDCETENLCLNSCNNLPWQIGMIKTKGHFLGLYIHIKIPQISNQNTIIIPVSFSPVKKSISKRGPGRG